MNPTSEVAWPKSQTIARYARLCGLSLGYVFFNWDEEKEGSIVLLDPKAYDDKVAREDQNRLDPLLPAEVRRGDIEEAWRGSLPRRRLAEHLVKLRVAKGLTQKEQAARIGLDPAEVSRMESATQPWPKAERLELYASALDSNVGLIFLEPEGAERRGWILPLAEPEATQVQSTSVRQFQLPGPRRGYVRGIFPPRLKQEQDRPDRSAT